MKKLIALMTAFLFLFGCATTIIKSKPSGAEVYIDKKLVGKTPYTFSSTAPAASKWMVTLKMEGYNDDIGQIKKNHPDWGAIILGCFFLWPLLWWADFPPEYNFEMEKIESKPTDLPTKPQVAPPEKPTTSPPVTSSTVVTVTWTSANIRSGAGNEFPIVATVNKGDRLTIIGERGEWFNVRSEDGKEGWIKSGVVK